MKRQFSLSTVPKWLSITLQAVLLAAIVLLAWGVYVYYTVESNKTAGFDDSEAFALEHTDITTVTNVSRYNGNEIYHVIEGTADDGTELIAYIIKGDDNPEDILVEPKSETVSQDQITESWNSTCSSDCKLLDVSLAIKDEAPMWEVKFRDTNDRFSYQYYDLLSGEEVESFSLSNFYR